MYLGIGTGTRYDNKYRLRIGKHIISKKMSVMSYHLRFLKGINRHINFAYWKFSHKGRSLFMSTISKAGSAKFNNIRSLGGRQYR